MMQNVKNNHQPDFELTTEKKFTPCCVVLILLLIAAVFHNLVEYLFYCQVALSFCSSGESTCVCVLAEYILFEVCA